MITKRWGFTSWKCKAGMKDAAVQIINIFNIRPLVDNKDWSRNQEHCLVKFEQFITLFTVKKTWLNVRYSVHYKNGGELWQFWMWQKLYQKLYNAIDEAKETHQHIVITGKRGNAVLISEEDWAAISETLHLLSIPGMRESIKNGMKENISECAKKIDWWAGN